MTKYPTHFIVLLLIGMITICGVIALAGKDAEHTTTNKDVGTSLREKVVTLSDLEIETTQGNLVISQDTRIVFDNFLDANTGANSDSDGVVNRFAEYAHRHLPANAAVQAITLFQLYVDYGKEVEQLTRDSETPEIDMQFLATQSEKAGQAAYFKLIEDQLDTLSRLRQQYFTEETNQAFFEMEEAINRYSLARSRLMANPQLSEQELQLELEQLQAILPPTLRDFEQQAQANFGLFQQTQALNAQNADPQAILELREQYLGKETAEKMAAFEARELAWNQRSADFQRQAREIDAINGLSEIEKHKQIQHLLKAHFTDEEQERLRRDEQARTQIDD